MQEPDNKQHWLPRGKQAAVCFSIDDVHPGTSKDAYEAGGDLGDGALGRVVQLLQACPQLNTTLFVTPNWRPLGLVQRRTWLTRIPWVRDRVYWTTLQPRNKMRVDRHSDFVTYLNAMPRTDVAMHGLTHLHRGPNFAVEFQQQSRAACTASLQHGLRIFESAGLRFVPGFQPPAWNLPDSLVDALAASSFRFVSSSRDLKTAITPDARCNMSGLQGTSLIFPEWLRKDALLHIPTNFQASSEMQRAFDIADAGGLIAIKAHIFKSGGGHTMIDGLDERYCAYLAELVAALTERYGDALWWTTMREITERAFAPC